MLMALINFRGGVEAHSAGVVEFLVSWPRFQEPGSKSEVHVVDVLVAANLPLGCACGFRVTRNNTNMFSHCIYRPRCSVGPRRSQRSCAVASTTTPTTSISSLIHIAHCTGCEIRSCEHHDSTWYLRLPSHSRNLDQGGDLSTYGAKPSVRPTKHDLA